MWRITVQQPCYFCFCWCCWWWCYCCCCYCCCWCYCCRCYCCWCVVGGVILVIVADVVVKENYTPPKIILVVIEERLQKGCHCIHISRNVTCDDAKWQNVKLFEFKFFSRNFHKKWSKRFPLSLMHLFGSRHERKYYERWWHILHYYSIINIFILLNIS